MTSLRRLYVLRSFLNEYVYSFFIALMRLKIEIERGRDCGKSRRNVLMWK